MSADQIPESTKMTRIYVRWSVDGQFIRKWSREPFVDGDPVDAIGRVATDGEALSWRLDRIIEDGGPLTLSDKAVLREAAALLSNRAAPPAMDREAEYVAGPIWAEQEDDCFTAEIQTVGGHYVVATVHGATRDEAERRQTAILSTLSADAIRQGEGGKIPADIAEHVRKIGKVEWGQTPAHDADGHGSHVADSVRLTAANFGQTEDQHMHGLWLEGTETVLCHTGTSPNAPKTTQALVGAWNWLVDQALALPASNASDGGKA